MMCLGVNFFMFILMVFVLLVESGGSYPLLNLGSFSHYFFKYFPSPESFSSLPESLLTYMLDLLL